jgi:hypothetical protein
MKLFRNKKGEITLGIFFAIAVVSTVTFIFGAGKASKLRDANREAGIDQEVPEVKLNGGYFVGGYQNP